MQSVSSSAVARYETDPIVESGVISGYTGSYYRKYASGIVEQYYLNTIQYGTMPSFYNNYAVSLVTTFPIQLKTGTIPLEASCMFPSQRGATPVIQFWNNINGENTTNKQLSYMLWSFYPYNLTNYTIRFKIVGYYK